MSSIIRELRARERYSNYVTQFFQSLAVPRGIENFEEENIYGYSGQWRLDFPKSLKKECDANLKSIFGISMKILNRGKYTFLSPNLELVFKKTFSYTDAVNMGCYYRAYSADNNSDFWFDSSTEKNFYVNVLSEIFGSTFKTIVLPQVKFHSLVFEPSQNEQSKNSEERVDFLITLPKHNLVIELDGLEHQQHTSKDYSRTIRLKNAGFEEIRISNEEVLNKKGQGLDKLKKYASEFVINTSTPFSNADKYYNSFKIAHQVQITILELLYEGALDFSEKNIISFDFECLTGYTKEESIIIISEAIKDLQILLSNLCEIYELPKPKQIKLSNNLEEAILVITYNENLKSVSPKCILQDISFPYRILTPLKKYDRLEITDKLNENQLLFFLEYIFNFNKFREGQAESLKRILRGKDTITLLPTGAGKSLIFQLATLLLPGISIIVVPINSLMNDQVLNLKKNGIDKAIPVSSDLLDPNNPASISANKQYLMQQFYNLLLGEYLFIYVSPERFLIREFRNTLKEFTQKNTISLIVIDEAHCVSEWGHDFRPAYLSIDKNSREYCKNKEGYIPPIIALTGTASENALLDIKEELNIKDDEAIVSPTEFDRKELHFNIVKCPSIEKFSELKIILEKELPKKFKSEKKKIFSIDGYNTYSGIIFCPFTTNTPSNPRGVEFYCENINNSYGDISKRYYSRDLDKAEKHQNANDFQNNKFPLLVATKGYGMGIDKPNVRYIVHVNLPPSIESFYQEAGRAGRDGKPAECFIIYSTDQTDSKLLLDVSNSFDEIKKIYDTIGGKKQKWDDIYSLFKFHISTFRGKKEELKFISDILSEIGDLSKEHHPFISKFNKIVCDKMSEDDIFRAKQKAIFRLMILGVISNYEIDFSSKEFIMDIPKIEKEAIITNHYNYVKRYNPVRAQYEKDQLLHITDEKMYDFIISVCTKLMDYIYDYYEKGRRFALSTMLDVLIKSEGTENPDSILREEISNYLKRTYSKQIKTIVSAKSIKQEIFTVQSLILGPKEEHEFSIKPFSDYKGLEPQINRFLVDHPENVGLFYLRAYARARISSTQLKDVLNDINTVLKLSFNKYRLPDKDVFSMVSWLLIQIIKDKPSIGHMILNKLVKDINNELFCKEIILEAEGTGIVVNSPKLWLINNIYSMLKPQLMEA